MMRVILVATFLISIVTMACGASAITSESDSGASPQQSEESGPALLLSEESAISILQSFLQECVLGWDNQSGGESLPSEESKSRLIDIAAGTTGDIVWSARFHGVTKVPGRFTHQGNLLEEETWVVIGPGFAREEAQLVVPARWKVYAGIWEAYALDVPTRIALEEYDSYGSCPDSYGFVG